MTLKLSVRVITYNQARFVGEALESALAQRVSFPYEIVVGDDGSTDGTQEIVLDYERRYPDRVRALTSDANRGGRWNFVRTLQACRGQYVALLDGDDYWTAPDKLARQVEFLDRRPDYAISFHDALVVYEDDRRASHRYCEPSQPETSTLEDLLTGNFVPACSVLLRRQPWQFADWFQDAPVGDWPLLIMTAERGKVGYLPESMGVYRVHSGGISHDFLSSQGARREKYLRDTILMLRRIGVELGHRHDRAIQDTIARRWLNTYFDRVGLEPWPQQAPAAVSRLFDRWEKDLSLPRRARRRILAAACRRVAMHLSGRDRSRAVGWLLQAIRHDPAVLFRTGFWSLALETGLGQRAAQPLRTLARMAAVKARYSRRLRR